LHVAVVVVAGVDEIVAEIHDVGEGGMGEVSGNKKVKSRTLEERKSAAPKFNFQKNLAATRPR
jgi:hypothetical protein